MPNGISQLDQFIYVLRVVEWHFHFVQILIEHSVYSGDPDQTAASDLGLQYLSISHKKDTRLKWGITCRF